MLKHFIKIRQPRSKDVFVSLWRRIRGCTKRRNELDKYYAKRKMNEEKASVCAQEDANSV